MPRQSSRQAEAGPASSHPHRIEERAVLNTLYRSTSEVAGRLASLLLFAVAGHVLGVDGLGAFVFAVAFLGFVMVPVDLGLDRYMVRAIARERSSSDHLFFNAFVLKLALAPPVFGVALIGLGILGHNHQAWLTTLALAPGVLCDSLARTQYSLFMGYERNGPPSLADATQRICSAVLGIAALELGFGVVSLGITYSIGSLIGVMIGFVLLPRTIGLPARNVSRSSWRGLASRSLPFATQDIFTVLLARVDVLLLALIATQAAVGIYGAAYRLFESTIFVAYALAGAYAAMFTYLRPDGEPPLRSAFQRSIKLVLVLLTPVAVAFAVLGGPICRLIYGESFASAGTPLAILGPAVVLLGIVTLSTSLMVSRENPRKMIPVTAAMAAINVGLNLALIPAYGASGAAAAMLATEVIFATWILRMATRAVGSLQWVPTAAGALAAAATMTLVTLALHNTLVAALLCGLGAYLLVLYAVERLLSPGDVELLTRVMLRRRSSSVVE